MITEDQLTWRKAPGLHLRQGTQMETPLPREGNTQGLRREVIWDHFERRPWPEAKMEPETPIPGHVKAFGGIEKSISCST